MPPAVQLHVAPIGWMSSQIAVHPALINAMGRQREVSQHVVSPASPALALMFRCLLDLRAVVLLFGVCSLLAARCCMWLFLGAMRVQLCSAAI